jgi:hypothetical protein
LTLAGFLFGGGAMRCLLPPKRFEIYARDHMA